MYTTGISKHPSPRWRESWEPLCCTLEVVRGTIWEVRAIVKGAMPLICPHPAIKTTCLGGKTVLVFLAAPRGRWSTGILIPRAIIHHYSHSMSVCHTRPQGIHKDHSHVVLIRVSEGDVGRLGSFPLAPCWFWVVFISTFIIFTILHLELNHKRRSRLCVIDVHVPFKMTPFWKSCLAEIWWRNLIYGP